jgi:hypothetical protein
MNTTNFTDDQITLAICGIVSVDMVKYILEKPIYAEGKIDPEEFTKHLNELLDEMMPNRIVKNRDWACGYVTADNLNKLL